MPLRGSCAASVSLSAPSDSLVLSTRGLERASKLPVLLSEDALSIRRVKNVRWSKLRAVRWEPSCAWKESILAWASMYMRVLHRNVSNCPSRSTFAHHRFLQDDVIDHRASHPIILLNPTRSDLPFRQAQQQVLLCALREAGNIEPANTPVAVLVFGAGADTNGVFDHIAAGGSRVDGGSVCQSADELHLCERSGCGGGEGAGAGARQGGAEGKHCKCAFVEDCRVLGM
jgi:hypothetical protein